MMIHRRVLVGLVTAIAAIAVASAASAHVFRLREQGARQVSVAGSFNGWSATASPLADADGDGVWEADVDLRAGSYQYKFVVNGTDWKIDPENSKKAPDGLGGENSVVEIAAGAAAAAPRAAAATSAGGARVRCPACGHEFVPAAAAATGAAPAAAASPARSGGHVFRLRAQGAQRVSVAGSFNGWNMDANPLADADGDGVWEATVNLPAGAHQYKFVVNGTDWKIDPENPTKAPDGLGGENSVVTVSASGSGAAPAAAAPAPTPAAGGGTLFSVEAPGAQKVELFGSWNGWSGSTVMTRGADGVTWSATMTLQAGTYEYKFMKDGDWEALNKDNRTITVP